MKTLKVKLLFSIICILVSTMIWAQSDGDLYLITDQYFGENEEFFQPVSIWNADNGRLDFVENIYPDANDGNNSFIHYNQSKYDLGNIFYSQELNKFAVSYIEYNEEAPYREKLVFSLLNFNDVSISKFELPRRGKFYYNSFFVENNDNIYIKYGLFGSEDESLEYGHINISTKDITKNTALKNENIMQSGNGFHKMNGPGIQIEDYLDGKIYSSKTSLLSGFEKGTLIGDLSKEAINFENPNVCNRVLKLCSNSNYEIYYLRNPYDKSIEVKTCTYFIKDKNNNEWSSLCFENYTRVNLYEDYLCWTSYYSDNTQINLKNLGNDLSWSLNVEVDNDILFIDEGKTLYYRENDAIFSYELNKNQKGTKSKLLVQDPKVVNVHWAFIKKASEE